MIIAGLLRDIVKYSKEHGPWIFYRMPLYYRELYGEDGVVRWAKKWKVDAIIAQLKDVDVEKLNKLNIPIIIQNYKDAHHCQHLKQQSHRVRLYCRFYMFP